MNDPYIANTYARLYNVPRFADYQVRGFTVIAASVRSAYPEAVIVPSLLTATTDTRHYIDLVDNQYRFHGMMIAASQVKSSHGTDEYIGVDSYEKSIAVARQLMEIGARLESPVGCIPLPAVCRLIPGDPVATPPTLG